MSKTSAGEVWRRISFLPCNVIDDLESFLFQRHPDAVNVVQRSANPDGSIFSEHFFAKPNPSSVELMLFIYRGYLVPVTLIY